jgi:hypothetical protein
MKYIFYILLLFGIIFIIGCGSDIPTNISNETLNVREIKATQSSIGTGETTTIAASVDYSGDTTVLMYTWTTTGGKVRGSGNRITYESPNTPGLYSVSVKVTDGSISSGNTIEIVVTQQSNTPTIIIDSDTHWPSENKSKLAYDVNITKIASGKVLLRFEITQDNDIFDAFLSIQIDQQTVLPEMAIGNEQPSTGKVTTRDVDVSGVIKSPGRYVIALYMRPGNRAQNGWLLNEAKLIGVEGSSDPQQ